MSIQRRITEPVRGPVRRNLDHYRRFFEDLIHAVKAELASRLDRIGRDVDHVKGSVSTVSDQLAMQAASIRTLTSEVERLQELTEQLAPGGSGSRRLQQLVGAPLAEIDGPASSFLNYASAWNGPLAEVGLFINDPYLVEWREGGANVRLVNERIIEQPFVYSAVADLPLGSRMLDIGGGESIVALALASLGHQVTVVEPRGYPFKHPNLTVFEGPIEKFESTGPFDAVILLSTIEHLGIGHYDDGTDRSASADLEAMKIVAELAAPGGRLVLTVPYGPAEVTELERIYDRDGLLRLLDGWKIANVAIGRAVDDVTWEVESTELGEPAGPHRVAMLVATPTTTSTKRR
jgi:SAM-dependent methyltransferase